MRSYKNKKVYVDICDNLKMFSILENTKDIKKKINNARLKKLVNFFLLFKYHIYSKFNIIKEIEFEHNKMYVIYTKNKYNIQKIEGIINRLTKKNKTQIVLSKSVIRLLKYSKKSNIKECTQRNKLDKALFIKNIYQVLKYVVNLRDEAVEENNIYVLVKNINSEYRELLINLSIKFKNLNIITNNIKEFKNIENYIYENYGISTIVSNNKRKGLIRARYIVNLQYNENEINEFNLNRDSIIFNFSENTIKNIKGFNGIIINNVELKSAKKTNKKQYVYSRFLNYMENNDLELFIGDLVGNNGYIATKEFTK